MNEYVEWLVQQHGRSSIFVDTNILLLLVVGSYDRNLISQFKRTRVYTPEDFDLAVRFVGSFGQVVSTPSVLAEVSNLAGQLGANLRAQCFTIFAQMIEMVQERHVESVTVARLPEFARFGLTDTTIMEMARGKLIVLTDDLRLYDFMVNRRLPVLNFTHLRQDNLF